MWLFLYIGDNIDFDDTEKIIVITAGTNRTIKNITVTNDNIVEGNETFTMSLSTPETLHPGIVTGSHTNATGTIIDTSSKLYHLMFI